MGELVGVVCASHSPGLTGFPDRADPAKARAVLAAFGTARDWIAGLAPDAIIAVSVEHFTNFSLANLPAFAICEGASHVGPVTPQMAGFLRIEQRRYAGEPELGAHLYRFALDHDFDPALVEGGLAFDENFCVPLHLLAPGTGIPVVPVIVNGVNPPFPTPRRCYALGQLIRAAVAALPGAARVLVLATGGLSHSVGTPAAGEIDVAFDREFLRRIADGSAELLAGYTDEQIDVAGNGAHEIRTWIAGAGAAAAPLYPLVYEPVPQWLTGTAVATSAQLT